MNAQEVKDNLEARILYRIGYSDRGQLYEGRLLELSPKEQNVKIKDLADGMTSWHRLEDVQLVDVFPTRQRLPISFEDTIPPIPPQPRETTSYNKALSHNEYPLDYFINNLKKILKWIK